MPAVDGSIVAVGALTEYALLHPVCDMKALQMNVQCSLIRELILYEVKLDDTAA